MSGLAHELSGKRILVTGAGGFVGRAVMSRIAQIGARPVGLVRRHDPAPGADTGAWVYADLVTDPLDGLLSAAAPDGVIHCAGRASAPDTDAGRTSLYDANLMATVRLIAALSRMSSRPRVVVVSSAAIWAPMQPDQSMIDEQHPIRPSASYGVSKAAATLHALAEADRLDLDLAVAVLFNVIGPNQHKHMVPQVFIDAIRANPFSFALQNADVVRDWIDLTDVADALVALSRPNGPRGMFNVSTGTGRSLKHMIGEICKVGGWTPSLCPSDAAPAPGVAKSIGNPQKLRAATDWAPKVDLAQSLHRMIYGQGV